MSHQTIKKHLRVLRRRHDWLDKRLKAARTEVSYDLQERAALKAAISWGEALLEREEDW